ncbi:MAG: hypothetical protein ACIRZW_04545 [Limosilactobacillus mucosae]
MEDSIKSQSQAVYQADGANTFAGFGHLDLAMIRWSAVVNDSAWYVWPYANNQL